MIINNIPEYAKNYTYIVARDVDDNELWFYGAYNDGVKAQQIADEIHGQVYQTKFFVDREN